MISSHSAVANRWGRGPHEVERQRRGEEAECRQRTRPVGHEDARHPENAPHLPRVHGTRAAEGKQRIASQVLAALDAVHAGGGRHVLVDDAVDAPRGLGEAQAHPPGHALFDGPAGRFHVEAHAATQEELGVEVAQQQVRVGDGRLVPSRSVAGRHRHRPPRCRARP